jgi:uncharacterized protein YecE (DUF72 family)
MKIYVGTSGYGYGEWKGKFYPEKISPKEMLRKRAFIFFKHEEEAKGPKMALRFQELADLRVKKIQDRQRIE